MNHHQNKVCGLLQASLAASLLALSASSGCASTHLANVDIPALPTAATDAIPHPSCELRLYLEHKGESEIFAFDRTDLVKGVCIKWSDRELEVPDDIPLASTNLSAYLKGVTWKSANASSICQRKDSKDGTVSVEGATLDYCVWNHAYRSKFPFSIRLKVEAGEKKLKDFVHLVRIFENGRLVFAWNKASNIQELVIPYQALKDTGLPFDAPLDLMILPSTVEVDEASINTQAVAADNRYIQVAGLFGQAVIGGIVAAEPKLKGAYDCYLWRLNKLSWDLNQIAQGTNRIFSPQPTNAATCNPLAVQGSLSLVKKYQEAKEKGQKALLEAENKALVEIDRLNATAGQEVRSAKQYLTDDFNDWISKTKLQIEQNKYEQAKSEKKGDTARVTALAARLIELQNNLRDAEARLLKALALADDVQYLAQDLKASYGALATRLVAIKNNPAEQAKIFGYVAQQLEANGSPFQQITSNPQPASGERVLKMGYRESWQWYLLAPWTGIPLKIQGGNSEALFDESNILPIIDVVGGRWQWGQSRFQEVRVGLGVMFFSDKVEAKENTTTMSSSRKESAETKKTENKFSCGPEANLGLGNLRLGFTWGLCRESEGSLFRFIVGADLVKLFTGQNVELF